MSRAGLILMLVATTALGAENAEFDRYFDALVEQELVARSKLAPEQQRAARFSTVNTYGYSTSPLFGLTTAELISASIQPTTDGLEAGVQFSPFAKREDLLAGLNLTLGTIEKGLGRIAVGWSYESNVRPTRLADLVDESGRTMGCALDRDAAIAASARLREPLRKLCSAIPDAAMLNALDGHVDEGARRKLVVARDNAAEACTPGSSRFANVSAVRAQVFDVFERYEAAIGKLPQPAKDGARLSLARVQQERADLAAFEPESFYPCPEPEEIAKAVDRWLDARPRLNFGLQVRSDLFDLRWGYLPSCDVATPPLECRSDAHPLKRLEGAAAGDLQWGRWTVSAGFGVASDREGRNLRPTTALSPKLAFRYMPELFKDGPKVVVGVQSELDWSLTPPPTQVGSIDSVTVLAHVDVTVSDTLSFRLGAPLRGELAVRAADADNGIVEKKALQWSLPAFVGTALKLD